MKFAITIDVELEPEMTLSGDRIDEESVSYNLWTIAGDVVGQLVHNERYPRTIQAERREDRSKAKLRVERIEE